MKNTRWLSLVIFLLFATTIGSIAAGHAIFIYIIKPDIELFKKNTVEKQILQEKPLRIQI